MVVVPYPTERCVDGGDENLPKGLVSLAVIVEEGGGNVIGIAKLGDMGDRHDRCDGGLGAGVDRSNEG